MQHDRRGIAITSASSAAVAHIERAVAGFLAHRNDTATHLAAALTEDRDLVVAHCVSGFGQLLLGRAELFPLAEGSWRAARAALAQRGGTTREHALTDALGAWCGGEMELCAFLLEKILASAPRDALTAKLVQSVLFMLGDAAGMRHSIESILPFWSAAMPGYGFMLGCHAFALEETGALDEAQEVGRQALVHEPFDVWACHAVAHVHETRGEATQGIAWIAAHEARWRAVNNFARHMDWHRALFHLSRRESDTALAIYDRRIRDVQTDDYRDITNATSLLRRLESAGVTVGKRWSELADLAERRANDHALVFAQLHYLLCLTGDRRWDAAYCSFAAMDLEARTGHGTQARLLGEIGVPLAKVLLARAENTASDTAASFALREGIARLGGSRAQRETFARILDEAEQPRRDSGWRDAMTMQARSSRLALAR